MADSNEGRVFQPDGNREYKSEEGNVDLPNGQTHFHTWDKDGSWEESFTTTTAIGIDEDTAAKIHENPFTDEDHTEKKNIHGDNKSGTDNIGTGDRHDNDNE